MPMATARTMTISNEQLAGDLIFPDWPAPANVRCVSTTRRGGVSRGAFASLNLGCHVGDDPAAVAVNRDLLTGAVGCRPVWLDQVHGIHVVDAGRCLDAISPPKADAAFARQSGAACAVMTADCLPVLFCDDSGSVVAAAHAGWRGLLAGVLESTIAAMKLPGKRLMAWLGPAIGPRAFAVGEEVRASFVGHDPEAAMAFQAAENDKWLADIYRLARQHLAVQGIERVFGGDCCTVGEPDRFFSYRRDGQTGRMASMIWLKE